MVGRYAVYAANLISMMILARLFTPEQFGVVAAIQVFFLFFQVMAEAGLGPAIINVTKLEVNDRNGLFGLTVFVGCLLSIGFYFSAPLFSAFYGIARIDEIVPYATWSLFFFAASIVPNALLQREQAFFRIANAGLVAELLSTLLTVILIKWFDPLYVLAGKISFSALSSFVLLYYFSANTEFGRPKLGIKFSAIMPLLSFSLYQFGFNVVNYFSRNLDNVLIGKYLGAASLGVYDKAYQLMKYPLMLLTFAMTPAIQPVIRKYANDIDKIERIHRLFTFKLSLLGASAGLSIFLLADWIVLFVLGQQWVQVIPIIEVLSISVPVQIVLSTSGSFFQALNRANLLFYSGVFSAVIMVLAILFGIYKRDMVVLSWALVGAFHINFIQAYTILYIKVFKKNFFGFAISMVPAVCVVLVIAYLALDKIYDLF